MKSIDKIERLLKIRRVEEDLARECLFNLRQSYREELRQVEEVVRLRDEARDELRRMSAGTVPMSEVIGQRRYRNVLFRLLREREVRLRRLEPVLDERQESFEAARNRRRAVEKLRDKRIEAMRRERQRREAKTLDEIGQRRRSIVSW